MIRALKERVRGLGEVEDLKNSLPKTHHEMNEVRKAH